MGLNFSEHNKKMEMARNSRDYLAPGHSYKIDMYNPFNREITEEQFEKSEPKVLGVLNSDEALLCNELVRRCNDEIIKQYNKGVVKRAEFLSQREVLGVLKKLISQGKAKKVSMYEKSKLVDRYLLEEAKPDVIVK